MVLIVDHKKEEIQAVLVDVGVCGSSYYISKANMGRMNTGVYATLFIYSYS